MGLFDFLKKKKSTKKTVIKSKSISTDKPKDSNLEAKIKGKSIVKGTLTAKKTICKKHDFKLFSVSGQRVIACKNCGKREANNDIIDLNIASLIKQN